MRLSIFGILTTILTSSLAAAQQRPEQQVKVLTVCEVLAHIDRFANTAIVIVGRLEEHVSLADRNSYLSQDHCSPPLITHGHIWANQIKVEEFDTPEPGVPEPPRDQTRLSPDQIAEKLVMAKRHTPLGSHQEPFFVKKGEALQYVGRRVSNQWVTAYGLLYRSTELTENCREGCSKNNVPLILITTSEQVVSVQPDGTPVGKKE